MALALVPIDVQRDFLNPEGNFPCSDDSIESVIQNTTEVISEFRDWGDHVIWVKSIYEDREEETDKMKMYKARSKPWLRHGTHVNRKRPCCIDGTCDKDGGFCKKGSCCKKDTFGSMIQ